MRKIKITDIYFGITLITVIVLVVILNNKNNLIMTVQPLISEEEQSLITEQNKIKENIKEEYSKQNYSLDNPYIKVDPYEFNELSALVKFETNMPVKVEYKVMGDIPFNLKIEGYKNSHEIPIIGLYSDRINLIEITTITESGDKNVTTIEIETEKITMEPLNYEIREYDVSTEYIMAIYPVITTKKDCFWLDTNGEVRLFIPHGFTVGMIFTEEGTILTDLLDKTTKGPIEGYASGILETDYLGQIINYYKVPYEVHHSFQVLPNRNLLVATSDESLYIEDSIIEIDRNTGEIVNEYDFKEILDVNRELDIIENHNDWFHINSVYYDENNDAIIVSGRHQGVISIDRKSQKINWILAEDKNWTEEYKKYLLEPIGENFNLPYGQHSAVLSDNGNLILFDNGPTRVGSGGEILENIDNYSQGVEYKIHQKEMTIEQVWSHGKIYGSQRYSYYISSVYQLGNKNILINFGGIFTNLVENHLDNSYNKSYISEVDQLTDKVVRELELDKLHTYRVEEVNIPEIISISEEKYPQILYDDMYYENKTQDDYNANNGLRKFFYQDNVSTEHYIIIECIITNSENKEIKTVANTDDIKDGEFTAVLNIDTRTLEPGTYKLEYYVTTSAIKSDEKSKNLFATEIITVTD